VIMAAANKAKPPLAWVRFEADGKSPGGGIRLQMWSDLSPGELDKSFGRADFHARWIDWTV